jgi:putative MATE family efflux protein
MSNAKVPRLQGLLGDAMLYGPIIGTLLKLALPTLLVLLAQTAVSVVEAFYLGFLGTPTIAGVALVFPLFMLMMTMSAGGIGSGVSSAISRAVGSGRHADADAYLWHAVVLATVMGGLFTLLAFLAGPAIYAALGGRGEALGAAVRYSNYLFAGAIPLWILNLLSAALRGAGNPRLPALVTIAGTVIVMLASPLLIFGFGWFSPMGIAGAGASFLIYYIGAVCVMLPYMSKQKSGLRLRILPLQRHYFRDLLKVGLPAAASTILTNLLVILLTGTTGALGVEALAAYGIAVRLDYLIIPILFGLSSAVLTMVGVNVGAGNVRRAKRIAWIGSLLGAAVAQAIGLVVAVFPSLWLHLFSQDPLVTGPASVYLRIVCPLYGFYAFGFVLTFAAQGAGHVFWPFCSVAFRFVFATGMAWVCVTLLETGIGGIATVVSLSFFASALICGIVLGSKTAWQRPGPLPQ